MKKNEEKIYITFFSLSIYINIQMNNYININLNYAT